jgi:hypothetical protein
MRIVVDAAAGTSALEAPDDLERFSVEIVGVGDEAVALAPFGHLDGEHAWIAIDMVRAAAHDRVGDDWDERFVGMVAYAGTKGWLDEDSGTLRAHVNRS